MRPAPFSGLMPASSLLVSHRERRKGRSGSAFIIPIPDLDLELEKKQSLFSCNQVFDLVNKTLNWRFHSNLSKSLIQIGNNIIDILDAN